MNRENEKINLTCGIEVTAIPEIDDPGLKLEKSTEIQKGLAYGEVEVTVSNSALDRHGESILVEGVDTKNYKKNPVVLWGHEYSKLPIAKSTKIWKDQKGNLKSIMKFAHEIYDFADTVYKLVLGGYINAVSIGGRVKKWNEDYTIIEQLEMYEYSVVPVGAHPDALVTAKNLGIDDNTIRQQYEQFLHKSLVDKFKILPENEVDTNIKALRSLITALETTRELSKDTDHPEVKRVRKLITLKKNAIAVDKQSEILIRSINNILDK